MNLRDSFPYVYEIRAGSSIFLSVMLDAEVLEQYIRSSSRLLLSVCFIKHTI